MSITHIRLMNPLDITVKQNRIDTLRKLVKKAIAGGSISKNYQISIQHENVLDIDTKQTYRLNYKGGMFVKEFILINEED